MRNLALRFLAPMIVLTLSGPALAHAHLLRSTPAADATVTSPPRELRLKFSEGLELGFSGVILTGPDKAPVAIGTPSLDPADPALLVVLLADPLKPGRYDVEWHATATDTHKTKGHYGFTVAP